MKKSPDTKAVVLYNKEILPGYFLLGLKWKAAKAAPGQFVMLRTSGGFDPLLRRPLGIYSVINAGGKKTFGDDGIELLYKVVGKGTKILSQKVKGDGIDVLGPLGNGFTLKAEHENKKVILLSGGMGMVPLVFFAKALGSGTALFGCRSKAEVQLASGFKKNGCKLRVATEDGSAGEKGLATDLLKDEITNDSVVYACGPVAMLKATAAIAATVGAVCFVSLERAMACGIGACLGCAVKSGKHSGVYELSGVIENREYKMVCSDGPVFDGADIDWEAF